jgi:hypothetical protein
LGSTLLEVIVAAVILAAIIATAVHPAIDQAAGTEVVRSSLFVRVDDATQRILGEIEPGEIDTPPATGDSLSWQVPIDPDGDGSCLDADGAIQWGMRKNGVAVAGARATVRFVIDRVLDEAKLAYDLNGDGDQKDRFDQGHLERQAPDGTIERLTGSWLLQPTGNHGGDLDGDGVADPIFALAQVADPSLPPGSAGAKTIASLDLTVAIRLTNRSWVVSQIRRTILCQNDVH